MDIFGKKNKMDALHEEWSKMMQGLLSNIMSKISDQILERGRREHKRLQDLGRNRAAKSTLESFSLAASVVRDLSDSGILNESFEPPHWLIPLIELYEKVQGPIAREVTEMKEARKESLEYQKRIAEALERMAPGSKGRIGPN